VKAIHAVIGTGLGLAGLLAFAGYAADTAKPDAARTATIKPASDFEKCMPLTPGQKLEYHFSTDKPVNFNVHYHKGDMVYYPVKENKTSSFEGLYSPTVREQYCMMWENKSYSSDVQLEYRFKIVK
jgi:hypothetical protein